MTRHKRTSIVITTVFGFIYVMANAQFLPASEAIAIRVVGILAAVGLLICCRGPTGRIRPASVSAASTG